MNDHFVEVTEIEGQQISFEQLDRTCHRYHWAAQQALNKDVLEIACGSGPGIGLLAKQAKSLVAGDYSAAVLHTAKTTYGDMVDLQIFSAQEIPYPSQSFDVVLLFEAIYYIEDPEAFFAEAHRVLRPGGKLLVVTANKDIFGFNASPYSHSYLGVMELSALTKKHGFSATFEGLIDTRRVGLRQKILTPLKFVATKLDIIPKTMHGKGWLKKLFFGNLTTMPASIENTPYSFVPAEPIANNTPNTNYKVIYCTAVRD